MLHREIIALSSQIRIKRMNTMCGQDVELLNVKLVVHIVTTELQGVKSLLQKPASKMMYREIIAVCSEIHTKYINTVCGQDAELLNAKLVVHIVTTEP